MSDTKDEPIIDVSYFLNQKGTERAKPFSPWHAVPPFGATNEDLMIKLEEVEGKLDALHRKLDLIFGSNILLGGRFVELPVLEKKIKEGEKL